MSHPSPMLPFLTLLDTRFDTVSFSHHSWVYCIMIITYNVLDWCAIFSMHLTDYVLSWLSPVWLVSCASHMCTVHVLLDCRGRLRMIIHKFHTLPPSSLLPLLLGLSHGDRCAVFGLTNHRRRCGRSNHRAAFDLVIVCALCRSCQCRICTDTSKSCIGDLKR